MLPVHHHMNTLKFGHIKSQKIVTNLFQHNETKHAKFIPIFLIATPRTTLYSESPCRISIIVSLKLLNLYHSFGYRKN